MFKKRIFIGSANETKDTLAAPIARCLSKKGFRVERWWEVFEGGDLLLPKLMQVARQVDGAVFICKGTDRVWMRDTEHYAPRDNVIFELGLFIQQLGNPKRCIVVTDKDTHLHSDFNGVICLILTEEDITATGEEIAEHFNKLFSEIAAEEEVGEPQVYITETDPDLVRITSSCRIPPEWRVRALFFGTEGAQNWLSLEKRGDHIEEKEKNKMHKQLLTVVKNIKPLDNDNAPIHTFVSLGPGAADADQELIMHLSPRRRAIKYIPVDISEGLVNHAAHTLHAWARVPFGLLCDFEVRTAFIERRLKGRVQHPVLYSLLGNSLGNLDNREMGFMSSIQEVLKKGDYLLLEVATKTSEWELEKDMRFNLNEHSTATRRFYAQGIARHTGEGLQGLVNAYTQVIEVKEGDSDVGAEATSVDYVHKRTGTIIVSLRRYNWDELLTWLSMFNFTIVAESQCFPFEQPTIGIGVVLLKKM
ncbi:MAG: L-histidine N(alpha)-methyltransferase [Pyrinomonadaceae bacterium]